MLYRQCLVKRTSRPEEAVSMVTWLSDDDLKRVDKYHDAQFSLKGYDGQWSIAGRYGSVLENDTLIFMQNAKFSSIDHER